MKISGSSGDVVRGWSRWHWSSRDTYENSAPLSSNRFFTLTGDSDAFYFVVNPHTENTDNRYKYIMGCGLYDNCLPNDVIPNWFLLSYFSTSAAKSTVTNINRSNQPFSNPLNFSANASKFYTPSYDVALKIKNSAVTFGIIPDYSSGTSGLYSANNVAALQIPIFDADKYLKGTLKHIFYSGNTNSVDSTVSIASDRSMYVLDSNRNSSGFGTMYFYLGELS